jgi:hypothetical protein
MEKQVRANEDNDLKNRSGLYDPKKDKKKSQEINESKGNEPESSGLQYFTE